MTVQKTKALSVKALVMGAICVAASTVLSYIKVFELPQGGSITLLSMLPVMMFAYLYGLGPGLLAGFAYSLLQLLQGIYFYSTLQFLLDYPIAFTLVGFAGAFKYLKFSDYVRFPLAVAVGGLLRVLAHFVSGAIFFGSYAPEGVSPWLYSLGYQMATVGPDALLCVIGAAAIVPTKLLTRVRRMI